MMVFRLSSVMRILWLSAALMCMALFVKGQAYSGQLIHLKHGVVKTANNAANWLANDSHKFPIQVLMQIDGTLTVQDKSLLKQNGIAVEEYLTSNVYIAVVSQKPSSEIVAVSKIRFVTEVQSDWKVSQQLLTVLQNNSTGTVEVNVSLTDDVSLKSLLANVGATVIKDRYELMGYVAISLPAKNIALLASKHYIKYISSYSEDQPLNIDAKAINRMQVAAYPTTLGGYNLKGDGVAIGVGDNTSGVFHVDLKDRIINFNPAGYTNHGVHINGIVGGAGIKDPKGEGMAPAATLTNHFFSDVLDATPFIAEQYKVVATNNSYTAYRGNCDIAGSYNALSVGVDKLCLDYSRVLQVFAAANDGEFDCPPYPKGYGTIAGGYQTAKNALIVASTDKEYVNAANSSRGPIKDGRLKPEITAVGVDVNSATKSEEYLVASGTSMASPQVAAAAALLTERLTQINGTTQPRSDLLKALLINGADDIGEEGPDFKFGFGFLNVEHSLRMLDNNRYILDNVTDKGQKSFNITVPANTSQLKVLLYWHDEPASVMAEKQLVNDLDVEVKTPNGTVFLPLVLNSTPANVLDKATQQKDRLNNCEQVVIDNPIAGNYTINVDGFDLPSGSRNFVVAYNFLPNGLSVKYPLQGTQVKSDDSIFIYWDAPKGNGSFKLEYSTNDGGTWNTINNNVSGDVRHYKWMTPTGVNSGRCRVRLTRGSNVFTTEKFAITAQPVVELSSVQCPGYIQIEWQPTPNATGYEVIRKQGGAMVVVDTVANTSYIFSGLSLDSTYYVAVRPIVDNISGYRSIAISRQPIDGDCTGSISDGDIMIDRVMLPFTGRMFTTFQLNSSMMIRLRLRNLDDVPCDSYKISYSLNSMPWVTQTQYGAIPANGLRTVNVSTVDVSGIGDYVLQVAIQNVHDTDEVQQNDSLTYYFAQLPNDPINLDYSDGFEDITGLESITDTLGIGNGRRWDYQQTTDTGRIRSRVLGANTTITGTSSISLDAYKSCPSNLNTFTGTFNLLNYDATDDEVRLEFDYIVHGIPSDVDENKVGVRASDTSALTNMYNYNTTFENIGVTTNSGSISVTDALLSTGGQFSTSTQIQFTQNDTSVIASRRYGNGITIDNVRVYTVQNDMQLLSVVSPTSFACGVIGPVPLVVKVRNGVNNRLDNVQINYRLDNGAINTENIPSVNGKETIEYSFQQLLDISTFGSHVVDVWLSAAGDTYNKNDSINNYTLRNQPVVKTFPYKEDFEADDGFWFADGINNSWQYGSPNATKLNNAASGNKAWVTNLTGWYNDNEQSYLYSPCFDLTGMETPKLSFKLSLDIENCGEILCDAAYMEYSTDGERWEILGEYNSGVNWYTDSNYLVWNVEDKTMWQQAETYLPKGLSSMQLRYVLRTDPGTRKEGVGIDDINIYNEVLYAPDDNIISISPNPTQDGIINIEWGAHIGTYLNLIMSDVMGREVYSTSVMATQEGYNKTSLQTPLLSTGIYFMKMRIGYKTYEHKIMYLRK